MESSICAAEKQNKTTKKLIPWHCQQRYQTSLSQRSFNYSIRTNSYKAKIKSLLDNNKNLARSLERCKNDKENMSEKNNRNMDIIDISRIKLKEISENLKKVTASVDETYDLLQSQVEPNSATNFQGHIMPRKTFKKALKAASNFEALAEVTEDLEIEQNLEDNNTLNLSLQQDKTKPKAKKISPKAVAIKKDDSTVPKTKKQCLKTKNEITSKMVAIRTSKPSNDETPPSYLLGISSDSESFRNLIEQSKKASKPKTLKKKVEVKKKPEHRLGQCAKDSILNSGFLQDDLKETRKSASALKKKVHKITGDKHCSSNKISKSASTKKVKITSTQLESQNSSTDSWSTTDENIVESNKKPLKETNHDNLKIPTGGSKPNVLDTKAPKATPDLVLNVSEANMTLGNPKVLLERNEYMQSSTLKKKTVSLNEIFCEPNDIPKITIKLKNNKKSTNGSQKRVGFLLEEDNEKIEMINEAADPITELKTNKAQKRPLKESTQNVAAPTSKKRARLTLPPQVLEENKNTFVVTAEIHRPPDDYVPDAVPFVDKTCILKMQPTVVLTDIFGSTRQKSTILENVCYNANKVIHRNPRINEENSDSNSNASDSFDMQCNKENKICAQLLLEDRKKNPRQRSLVPTYKEMKLNVKMRRD